MSDKDIFVTNPHIKARASAGEEDVLYHFGISTGTTDFRATFGDVRFVCCGGSNPRMRRLYETLLASLKVEGTGNLSKTERFVLYKAGPVLCVSHGMGVPSMSVMLVETLKLLFHAGATKDLLLFRVGTCGGLGLEPGTVLVSNKAINAEMNQSHVQYVLGKRKERAAVLDEELWRELVEEGKALPFPVATGATLCTDDFYEGQGRLDGAFCEYDKAEKMAYLQQLRDHGVCNIEMESTGFASLCQRAGVRGAIACVAILDRLQGDQVSRSKEELAEFEGRPLALVASLIKRRLADQPQ